MVDAGRGAPPGRRGPGAAGQARAVPMFEVGTRGADPPAHGRAPAASGGRAEAYVQVAVDAGGRGTDRLFTYRVPAGLADRVAPGARVRVPFAGLRRPVTGVVFEAARAADVPEDRVRPVLEAPDAEPLLGPSELALARWLAERAVCTLAQALRPLLPPPGASPLEARAYWPAGPGEEAVRLLARAPSQLAAWRAVAGEPGLTAAELGKRGIRAQALALLVARGLVRAQPTPVRRDPFAGEGSAAGAEVPPDLTASQRRALAALRPSLDGPNAGVYLLWGVTGSGKTEVYLRAIEHVLAHGRQALVLVPEIALTPQTVALFRRRFPAGVAVLHSALSPGERHDEWWRIRRGEVAVAVGARSAVFAPFGRLGLIVIDEEHEPSYKQEEAPRYHARDVALWRARAAHIPLLLGSATPDVETFAAADRGEVVRLDLPSRVAGRPLPAVRVVDMRGAPSGEDAGLFSPELAEAVGRHLGAGRQALLFLNRRGFAPVLLCRSCGFVSRCQACAVALCYHDADRTLHCHYCGARRGVPRSCPNCGGYFLRLRGAGTERVAQEVERRFPGARVLRMDLDTTGTKGAHGRIYEQFRSGRADVLVGTQMVAKGWDVAGVTLVGVMDADTGLHHPDYRGAERTFQLLCQVAGRAGRGEAAGEVLVQTHTPDHGAVRAAAVHDYEAFARQELAARRDAGFPPYARLLRLLCWAPAASAARGAAEAMAEALRGRTPPGVDLWGPAEAPLGLLRGQHRWHLCLRGPDASVLRDLARHALDALSLRPTGARAAADPDPQSML